MANRLIQVPYKSGIIQNINGSVITLTTIMAGNPSTNTLAGGVLSAATDIGRAVVVAQGDGRKTERWITAVSGNDITLSDPFSTVTTNGHFNRDQINNNTTDRFQEGVPAANDEVVIAWNSQDMATAFPSEVERDTNSITTIGSPVLFRFRGLNDGIFFRPQAGVEMVWFNEPEADVEFNSRFTLIPFTADPGPLTIRQAGVTFGRVATGDQNNPDISGYPTTSVKLTDVAVGNQTAAGIATVGGVPLLSLEKGVWRHYGGSETVPGFSFNRYHNNTTLTFDAATEFTHFLTQIVGNFGSRVSGRDSVLRPSEVVGYDSVGNLGYSNPIRPGFIGDFTVRGADNVIYNFFSTAGSTVTGNVSIQDIRDQIVFMNNSSATPYNNLVMTLNNWSLDELRAETTGATNLVFAAGGIAANQGATRINNTFAITKDVEVTVVNADQSPLTLPSKFVTDDSGAGFDITTDNIDVATGVFPTRNLPAYSWILNNPNITSLDDSNARTVSFPYDYIVVTRGRQLFTNTTSLNGPVGPLEIAVTSLVDPLVTATDAQVDAYTFADLGTAEAIYNLQSKEKFDNPTHPVLTSSWFTRSGNTLTNIDLPSNLEFSIVIDTTELLPDLWDYDAGNRVLTVAVPATGTNANFGVEQNNVLTFRGDATNPAIIRGGFDVSGTASVAFVNPSAGGTLPLIQTADPMSGTVDATSFPNGSVVVVDGVNGNDISNLVFIANTGQDLNLRLLNTTGTPTLVGGISVEVSLNVTLTGTTTNQGRIDIFRSTFPVDSLDNTTTATTISRTSGQDPVNILVGSTIIAVYSGGGLADIREEIVLANGVNELTLSAIPSPFPTGADFTNVIGGPQTYASTDTFLTVELDVNNDDTVLESPANFNEWFQLNVRGTLDYNRLLSNQDGSVNRANSLGAAAGLSLDGTFHRLTPSVNECISVGNIINKVATPVIPLTRTITAVIGGVSTTLNFDVDILAATQYDQTIANISTRTIVEDIINTNERIIHSENAAGYVIEVLGDNPLITAPGGNAGYNAATDYTPNL